MLKLTRVTEVYKRGKNLPMEKIKSQHLSELPAIICIV